MTCDPNEHKFVTTTSYSVSMETESAVVEEGSEEKRCEKCGKTPSELDDFVTPASATTTDEQTPNNSAEESTGNIETEDDAVIMQTDNSEAQSKHAHEPPATHKQDDSSSSDGAEILHQGDQDDDAYVIGGSNVDDTPTEQPQSEPVSGPFLVCPVCDYRRPTNQTPEYPGDSCPDCRQAYLEEHND